MTSPAARFRRTIAELFRARFPFVFVRTWEEDRLLQELAAVVGDVGQIRTPRKLFFWTVTTGMVEVGPDGAVDRGTTIRQANLLEALDEIERHDGAAVFVLTDFQ